MWPRFQIEGWQAIRFCRDVMLNGRWSVWIERGRLRRWVHVAKAISRLDPNFASACRKITNLYPRRAPLCRKFISPPLSPVAVSQKSA
jgi:hypothetical protein